MNFLLLEKVGLYDHAKMIFKEYCTLSSVITVHGANSALYLFNVNILTGLCSLSDCN